MKRFILSPCGTSLLTNNALDDDERKRVFAHANAKYKEDVAQPHRSQLQTLLQRITSQLDGADREEASKMSAEINGIVKIYDGMNPAGDDVHLLLSTDTWLGEATARLVEDWLRAQNPLLAVDVHRQVDLQTADITSFQIALAELVKKFSNELPGYADSGYKIIFNLTGGFKSVQGFLQSIAHFYADETVYIFESASELMRIPRLPIRMDAMAAVEKNISSLRNISEEIPGTETTDIPEIFLLTMDDKPSLSPWGEVVWANCKREIYQKRLLPSPRPGKIAYGKNFIKDIKALAPDRVEIVNGRIDQLNRHLNQSAYNPVSLDFKKLKGVSMKPSTHEMDAWADLDARRIFGHFEGELFVLDRLTKGLH